MQLFLLEDTTVAILQVDMMQVFFNNLEPTNALTPSGYSPDK
jgi:hypothetical protein